MTCLPSTLYPEYLVCILLMEITRTGMEGKQAWRTYWTLKGTWPVRATEWGSPPLVLSLANPVLPSSAVSLHYWPLIPRKTELTDWCTLLWHGFKQCPNNEHAEQTSSKWGRLSMTGSPGHLLGQQWHFPETPLALFKQGQFPSSGWPCRSRREVGNGQLNLCLTRTS